MNQPSNSEIVVSVSLGGETFLVDEKEWQVKADELVAKYGGVPKVIRLDKQTKEPVHMAVVEPVSPLVPKIVPKAPEVVRGKTVDLEGAIRSGMDFEAAEAAGIEPRAARTWRSRARAARRDVNRRRWRLREWS